MEVIPAGVVPAVVGEDLVVEVAEAGRVAVAALVAAVPQGVGDESTNVGKARPL